MLVGGFLLLNEPVCLRSRSYISGAVLDENKNSHLQCELHPELEPGLCPNLARSLPLLGRLTWSQLEVSSHPDPFRCNAIPTSFLNMSHAVTWVQLSIDAFGTKS
jgi:hypothetical protein